MWTEKKLFEHQEKIYCLGVHCVFMGKVIIEKISNLLHSFSSFSLYTFLGLLRKFICSELFWMLIEDIYEKRFLLFFRIILLDGDQKNHKTINNSWNWISYFESRVYPGVKPPPVFSFFFWKTDTSLKQKVEIVSKKDRPKK